MAKRRRRRSAGRNDKRIAKLYETTNLGEKGIAKKIGRSQAMVHRRLHHMFQTGRLKKLPSVSASFRDRFSPRVKLIISLIEHDATLSEIAEKLGVGYERARKLRMSVIRVHGEHIRFPKPSFSNRQVQRMLKIDYRKLMAACWELGIAPDTRGKRRHAFTTEDVEAVRRYLRVPIRKAS